MGWVGVLAFIALALCRSCYVKWRLGDDSTLAGRGDGVGGRGRNAENCCHLMLRLWRSAWLGRWQAHIYIYSYLLLNASFRQETQRSRNEICPCLSHDQHGQVSRVDINGPYCLMTWEFACAFCGCLCWPKLLIQIFSRGFGEVGDLTDHLPSGHDKHFANWKDPPCYQWVNPLFRLGHFQCRKLLNYQRGSADPEVAGLRTQGMSAQWVRILQH